MISNVQGRVKNTPLPKSRGLLPLFEAIINSIDAIEDIKTNVSEGTIDVKILRHNTFQFSADSNTKEERFRSPIYGFEITDNGIGFNDINYRAFNEADTRNKEHKGGKGVGRFIWLKAFKKVEIDSIFNQDGQLMHRSFVFSLSNADGISNHDLQPLQKEEKERTIVRLLEFDEEYEKCVPRNAETIAQRVVEHCLKYFVMGKAPMITLYDNEEDEPISLDDLYDKLVANTKREEINIKGIVFDIVHFMLHANSDLKHHLSYCANRRVVLSEKIGNKIANLPTVLTDQNSGVKFIYAGYVSSDYLDKRVSQQRIGFDTLPEDGLEIPGELTWSDIEISVLSTSRKNLSPYIETVRIEKEERIREYIKNQAPQFRHIIKNHTDKLDAIPPEISDEKLDMYLYDINRGIETNLKLKAEELLQNRVLIDDEKSYEEQLSQFEQWWQEYNEFGKSTLAKYIVHRKVILTILEKALQLQDTGKYSHEELIHKVIFPLKKTSDDVTYDQHNLWILDEKLAYHQYLASDLPLKNIESIESESMSELVLSSVEFEWRIFSLIFSISQPRIIRLPAPCFYC